MLFPTVEFVAFFFLAFPGVILLKPYPRIYKYYLLLLSIIFYATSGIGGLILTVIWTLANFLLLRIISKESRAGLLTVILINIVYLAVFKYANLFISQAIGLNLIPEGGSFIEIIAPLGISFYTFRIISHAFDLHRGKVEQPGLIRYANYVLFFPQVGAGPISRAKQFYQDLASQQKFQYDLNRVALLVLSGIFKKYVVASYLFELTFDPFRNPLAYSPAELVLSLLAYSALIFLDFSGYIDFAIALTELLGFRAPENFNAPYAAWSLKEFWNRWNISLSTWLRDYLYIPLGGNRKGILRKYLNLFLTMALGGLWHGAGLNYLLWGVLHGAGLVVNHGFNDMLGLGKRQAKDRNFSLFGALGKLITGIITFTFVTFAWSCFAINDWETLLDFYRQLGNFTAPAFGYYTPAQVGVIFLGIALGMFGPQLARLGLWFSRSLPLITKLALAAVILYALIRLGPGAVAPFIYFNF